MGWDSSKAPPALPPSPLLFANYSGSVASRVFNRNYLSIKALGLPRMMPSMEPVAWELICFSRTFHHLRVCGGAQVQMSHDGCGKLTFCVAAGAPEAEVACHALSEGGVWRDGKVRGKSSDEIGWQYRLQCCQRLWYPPFADCGRATQLCSRYQQDQKPGPPRVNIPTQAKGGLEWATRPLAFKTRRLPVRNLPCRPLATA
jgi:hypothetical protein